MALLQYNPPLEELSSPTWGIGWGTPVRVTAAQKSPVGATAHDQGALFCWIWACVDLRNG
jgi:hypothetical protein